MDTFNRNPSQRTGELERDDFDVHDPASEEREHRGPTPGKLTRGSRLKVMRKATGGAASPTSSRYLDSADRSSGTSLPVALKGRLENSLGADLDGVRVHTGTESAQAAKSVAAKAYTVGKDIHFGDGQYDPGSTEGQRLIAHEVAHTVQQHGGGGEVQTKLEVSTPGDSHEAEADHFADAFVRGASAPVTRGSVAAGIHRKPRGHSKKGPSDFDKEVMEARASIEETLVGPGEQLAEVVYRGFIKVRGTTSAVEKALADLEALEATGVGSKLLSALEKAASDDAGDLEVNVVDDGQGIGGEDEPGFAMVTDAGAFDGATMQPTKTRIHPKRGRIKAGYKTVQEGERAGALVKGAPGKPVPVDKIIIAYDTTTMDRLGAGEPSFLVLAHELIHALRWATGTVLPKLKDSDNNHVESRTTGINAYGDESLSENALRREIGAEERDTHGSVTGPVGRGDVPPTDLGPPAFASIEANFVQGDSSIGWNVSGVVTQSVPPKAVLRLSAVIRRGTQGIIYWHDTVVEGTAFSFWFSGHRLEELLGPGDHELALEVEPSWKSLKRWEIRGECWINETQRITLGGPKVHRKASGAGQSASATRDIDAASRSTGSALPGELGARLEESLGADLGGVRIHTGGESTQAAKSVAAKAYTVGQDIHFGDGQYDPGSTEGQRLIAHEVAHTVQQHGGGSSMQTKLEVSTPGDSHEVEADRFADAFVVGRSAAVSRGSVSGGIHRKSGGPRERASDITKTYRGFIVIVGEPAVVEETIEDLESIADTTVGAKIFAALEKEASEDGASLSISVIAEEGRSSGGAMLPTAGIIAESRAVPKGRYPERDFSERLHTHEEGPRKGALETLGAGQGMRIADLKVSYNTKHEEGCRPPFLSLAHELIHVIHAATGMWMRGFDDPLDTQSVHPSHEESSTIGLHGYSGDELTENAMRRELGIQERDTHASVCGPDSQDGAKKVSRKATGASVTKDASTQVSRAAASGGAPLDAPLRGQLEAFSGHDLGGVTVHTGAESAEASSALGAKAYADEQALHFAAGTYDPNSKDGQELIAHEVAHTIQQRNSSTGIQTKLEVSSAGDVHEQEADAFASAFVGGASGHEVRGTASSGTLHRKEEGNPLFEPKDYSSELPDLEPAAPTVGFWESDALGAIGDDLVQSLELQSERALANWLDGNTDSYEFDGEMFRRNLTTSLESNLSNFAREKRGEILLDTKSQVAIGVLATGASKLGVGPGITVSNELDLGKHAAAAGSLTLGESDSASLGFATKGTVGLGLEVNWSEQATDASGSISLPMGERGEVSVYSGTNEPLEVGIFKGITVGDTDLQLRARQEAENRWASLIAGRNIGGTGHQAEVRYMEEEGIRRLELGYQLATESMLQEISLAQEEYESGELSEVDARYRIVQGLRSFEAHVHGQDWSLGGGTSGPEGDIYAAISGNGEETGGYLQMGRDMGGKRVQFEAERQGSRDSLRFSLRADRLSFQVSGDPDNGESLQIMFRLHLTGEDLK